MMAKKTALGHGFVTALAALLLLAIIVSAGVCLALNLKALYYHDIDALHIADNTGLDREVIRRNYDVLIEYNRLGGRKELILPDFPMSESGRIHFQEVKAIFTLFQLMLVVSLGAFALLRIWAGSLRDGLYARVAGYSCFGITAALGLLALIGWDTMFVGFHHLFFNNDFWIFDAATDPVINILPDTFFLHEALLILAVVLMGGALALYFGYRAKRKVSQSQEKAAV